MGLSQAVKALREVGRASHTPWLAALYRRPLPFILLLQAAISLLILHNTAFEDEALYIHAGARLLRSLELGTPTPVRYAAFFSGYPYFYPLLAGALNQFGGLATVRLFSMLCMLVATVCVYAVTRRLFSQTSAYAGAFLFACAGPTLFLTQFATYDALSLMLLALATLAATQAGLAWTKGEALVALAVPPLLALAVVAKYAALLFVPFVLTLMVALAVREHGRRHALLVIGLALAALVVVAVALSFLITPDALAGLRFTTTNRQAIIRAPADHLLSIITSLSGFMLALSFMGTLFSPRHMRLAAIVLFCAALAAPAYHLYSGESVSLHKHLAFALFFAAPMAGFLASDLVTGFVPRIQTRVVVFVLIFATTFVTGAQNAYAWYHTWANTSQMVAVMHSQIRAGSSKYLCMDAETLQYYLDGAADDRQYTGPYVFTYTDLSGRYLTGAAAYHAAVSDGYFDVIELRVPATLTSELYPVIQAQPQYQLIARLPYTQAYSSGYYLIWAKRGAG